MQIMIVGTDRRQQSLSKLLQAKHCVWQYPDPTKPAHPDCIVLPCPSFDSTMKLRAACTLEELQSYFHPNTTVYCCGTTRPLQNIPVQSVDLLADETAVRENARLTAEAALLLTMEQSADTLQNKRCLIVGYGRIGSYLTKLLQAMGAVCTVLSGKAASRAEADRCGCRTATSGSLQQQAFDYVFNTAPAQVLSDAALAALPAACVWVELASAPGGLPQKAPPFAFRVLPAGGLPGRYLPLAAARVLYHAIERQLEPNSDKT